MNDPYLEKSAIRKRLLAERGALSTAACDAHGKAAARLLLASPFYAQSATVMLYMDFRNEVPTGSMLDHVFLSGKTAVLPFVDDAFRIVPLVVRTPDGLRTSRMGIREPDPTACAQADAARIDLVIVPGVAFDRSGGRLGYGRGCYDAFLPLLRPGALKIGLAYDFQIIGTVPTDKNDVRMDLLLTPSGLWPCHAVDL